MVIKPMVRNNICMNAHPVGCSVQVGKQVEFVKSRGRLEGPKNVLVIGASTGYGLASRIVGAFGCGAGTVGVFFEKPGSANRAGTSGWYNNIAFEELAAGEGLYAKSVNGDAFSDETKRQVIDIIRRDTGTVDLVVYSLASPVRTDPESGELYRSVIKPIGRPYTIDSLDPLSGKPMNVVIEPAEEHEILASEKVMGGEDWERWIRMLSEAGVLAAGTITVAYSYIGPEMTYAIYREGTIGRAKEHLERTVPVLDGILAANGGKAYVSVNKALVTRASAVIPVVPLYISLLYRVMKEMNIHERCVEQIQRLFSDRLCRGGWVRDIPVDDAGRIRLDDWELREDVQAEVRKRWNEIDEYNYTELADIDGFKEDFMQFHGFEIDGVDYDMDVEP